MKKLLGLLLVVLMLAATGCGTNEKTVETMADFKWGASENDVKQWHAPQPEELSKDEFKSSFIVRQEKYAGYACDTLYVLKRGGLTTVYYDFLEENPKNQVEQYKKIKGALEKRYGSPLSDEVNAGANMNYAASWDTEGIHVLLSLTADSFFLNYSDTVADKQAEDLTAQELQKRSDEAKAAALIEAEEKKRQEIRDDYHGVVAGNPYISINDYSNDVGTFIQINGLSLTLVCAEVLKLSVEDDGINNDTLPDTFRATLHDTLKRLKAVFMGAIKMNVDELPQEYISAHEQLIRYCEISVETCDYLHETLVATEKEYDQTQIANYLILMKSTLQDLSNSWLSE